MTPLRNADWLAEKLGGVSRDRVYYWVRLGIIPCIRLGRKLLFAEDQIDELIAQGGCPGTGHDAPDDPATEIAARAAGSGAASNRNPTRLRPDDGTATRTAPPSGDRARAEAA